MTAPVSIPRPAAGGRRARPRLGANANIARVAALHIKGIWDGFWAQSPGFWCASFYLFIEYVRPQQIYLQINFLPWGKLALGSAFLFALLENRVSFREHFLWMMVALFSAIILASSVTAYDPQQAYDNLNVWGIWLLAMIVVAGAARTRGELLLTFILWCLWNFKMSQTAFRSWMLDGFRFRAWGANGAPGWFSNSGEFGIEMCVFFAVVGYLLIGLWPSLSKLRKVAMGLVVLSAVIGTVASSSRGALVGLACMGAWILVRSKQRVRAGAIVLVLSGIVWVFLPNESKQRFHESGDDNTSTRRIQYWKDGLKIASEYPVLGVGYKNWLPYYVRNYDAGGQLPHNIFIECMAELGYTGLVVFLVLIFGTFRQNGLTRRLTSVRARAPDRVVYYLSYGLDGALIGYLASGFFVTVLYYPFFWINLAFTMALYRYASSRQNSTPLGSAGHRSMPRRGRALPNPSSVVPSHPHRPRKL